MSEENKIPKCEECEYFAGADYCTHFQSRASFMRDAHCEGKHFTPKHAMQSTTITTLPASQMPTRLFLAGMITPGLNGVTPEEIADLAIKIADALIERSEKK